VSWEVWIPVGVQVAVGAVAVYTTVQTIRQELTDVRRLAESNRLAIDSMREAQAYDRGRRDRRAGDGRRDKRRGKR